jgi:hypothetical protein
MVAKTAALATALTAGCLALVGCALSQSLKQKPEPTVLGGSGRLIAPRRCQLDVVILTRPQGDPILDDLVWRVADEQILDTELRHALQANGLRLGRVMGDLPAELESLLDTPPPDGPSKMMIQHPEGLSEQVDPAQAPPRPELALLISRPDGKVVGESYRDARALVRLTGTYDDEDGVALRIVPEIHHGPNRSGFATMPTAGLPAVREFRITSGQAEKTFPDLAATLDLKPGQVAVLGLAPGRPGSLGEVLLCKPDGPSDRALQALVLIWAARAEPAGARPAREGEPPPVLMPIDVDDLARDRGREPDSPSGRPSE